MVEPQGGRHHRGPPRPGACSAPARLGCIAGAGLLAAAAAIQKLETRHGQGGAGFHKKWANAFAEKAAAHPAVSVEVFCTDEHRLGPKPITRTVWALKGQRPNALGHHRFQWLYVTAFVSAATGETVWYLSNGVSKPLCAGLLGAFAEAVGAGPTKRVVLLLDNAGFHTRPNLAVPDGSRLVYLPPYSPELQPAKTLWPLVREPIVNSLVPTLDDLVKTIGAPCCDLAESQTEINSRTTFAWLPKNRTLG